MSATFLDFILKNPSIYIAYLIIIIPIFRCYFRRLDKSDETWKLRKNIEYIWILSSSVALVTIIILI